MYIERAFENELEKDVVFFPKKTPISLERRVRVVKALMVTVRAKG